MTWMTPFVASMSAVTTLAFSTITPDMAFTFAIEPFSIFTSKDFPPEQKEYIWDPKKSKKMYVDYVVPATNDTLKKGCVVMVLGYLAKEG